MSAVALSAAERVAYNQLFAQCDTQGVGYLTGDQVKALFTRAQLPQNMLSTVRRTGRFRSRRDGPRTL